MESNATHPVCRRAAFKPAARHCLQQAQPVKEGGRLIEFFVDTP